MPINNCGPVNRTDGPVLGYHKVVWPVIRIGTGKWLTHSDCECQTEWPNWSKNSKERTIFKFIFGSFRLVDTDDDLARPLQTLINWVLPAKRNWADCSDLQVVRKLQRTFLLLAHSFLKLNIHVGPITLNRTLSPNTTSSEFARNHRYQELWVPPIIEHETLFWGYC